MREMEFNDMGSMKGNQTIVINGISIILRLEAARAKHAGVKMLTGHASPWPLLSVEPKYLNRLETQFQLAPSWTSSKTLG